DPMPLVLNFVLLSLAGLLVGAALRATRLRAPKPLIRALHAFSLVALALALALAVSLARSSGPRPIAGVPALPDGPKRGHHVNRGLRPAATSGPDPAGAGQRAH